MRSKLLQRTAKSGGLLYVAEMHGGSVHHKMDHLVCFLPGMPCSMQTPSVKALLTDLQSVRHHCCVWERCKPLVCSPGLLCNER